MAGKKQSAQQKEGKNISKNISMWNTNEQWKSKITHWGNNMLKSLQEWSHAFVL